MRSLQLGETTKLIIKPGLHMVVTIAEHVCDTALQRIIKIFLVKDRYLRSLKRYGDHAIPGQLEKHVRKHVFAVPSTYMEIRLIAYNVCDVVNKVFTSSRIDSCRVKIMF